MKHHKKFTLTLENKKGESISTELNCVNLIPIAFDFVEAMLKGKANIKKVIIETKGA